MQLRKVTFLHSKNGTLDEKLGSRFLMVLEQFRKQFWNRHAKTWKNPRGPDGFQRGGHFCLCLVYQHVDKDLSIWGIKLINTHYELKLWANQLLKDVFHGSNINIERLEKCFLDTTVILVSSKHQSLNVLECFSMWTFQQTCLSVFDFMMKILLSLS